MNVRECAAAEIRSREVIRPNFKGYCRPCSYLERAEGTHRYKDRKGCGDTKRVTSTGYIALNSRAISDEHLPLFRKMQNRAFTVFEHRWVMALHLRRPLARNELVDHMNGNKTDNRLENLRIYVRGKQQPGSANGYGTYYHEWQMAEGRVRELEAELEAIRQTWQSPVIMAGGAFPKRPTGR